MKEVLLESSTRTESTEVQTRYKGVTPRVVFLSLFLAVFFGYVIPVIDFKLGNTFLGATHLPPGAIATLLILVGVVNPLLRLLGQGLKRDETLTVYITCLFSCLVPGHGSENFILPNLIAPFYFATRENRWLEFLQPSLKYWMTPALSADGQVQSAVVDNWYLGLPTNQTIPWGAWLLPLIIWGAFVLLSYWMLACLSIMLRGQWAEREALAFPLLKLPLELTEDVDKPEHGLFGRFFSNSMMWIGFGIAVFIEGLNGLNLYFPDVPAVPLELNLNSLFTDTPWNQLGWVPCTIFPVAVGISFLLTTEVSFSIWFFFWFIKFQYILAYYFGFTPSILPTSPGVPDKLFTGYQSFGCTLAFVGLVLWTGRAHIQHIMLRAFGRIPATREESTEVLSYPVAFWGFVASFLAMTAFTCLAGVRLDIALALWICYLVFAIALTRVAAEGGLLFLLHSFAPLGAVAGLVGGGWLTLGSGLVPAALLQAGMVSHMRGFTMPSFLHSFKLAKEHRIAPKPLGLLISAVIIISMSISWWMVVKLGYENGGLQLQQSWWAQTGAQSGPQFVTSIQNAPNTSQPAAWFWCAVGGLLTWLMMLARSYLPAFPFHPLGYVVATSFPVYMFWPGIMLGWGMKVLINRFGGVESTRKATPLFLGLVLGSVIMMLFWLCIDGWQGRLGHRLMPG